MAETIYIALYILSISVTIIFVIGMHEFAHFIAARLLGVKILRFSIGFGKILWRKIGKTGTEYAFALIPLGGYVKMLDEREGPVSRHELAYTYNRQPYYKKFLIVAAGPIMNLACALLLYSAIFMIGFTTIKPIIGHVNTASIAQQAGLKANQQIVSVNDHVTTGWTAVIFKLLSHMGNEKSITVQALNKQNTTTNHQINLANWKLNGLTPDPLASLGIIPYEPPVPLIIGYINKSSPAAKSPLKVGDYIIAVNGKRVKDWKTLTQMIYPHPGELMQFSVKRSGKTIKLPVKIGIRHLRFKNDAGYLGIGPLIKFPPEMLQIIKYPPLIAIKHAFNEVVDFGYFNLALFGKLLTGKLSLEALGGPITIFESAGTALNYGIVPFLSFLAFLSASVGIINLLPVPGLDGGHLLLETIEFIIRRPLPERIMFALYYAGFGLIIFILVHALINDFMRLI